MQNLPPGALDMARSPLFATGIARLAPWLRRAASVRLDPPILFGTADARSADLRHLRADMTTRWTLALGLAQKPAGKSRP
jgi:hypothetical protein